MKILIALLAVLFVLMQYKLWFGEGSVREGLELSRTTEAQQLENDQARQRNEVLAAEVAELKTGLESVEERARNELGMVKKDETFIHILEGQTGEIVEQ